VNISFESLDAAMNIVRDSVVIAGHTDFIADLAPRRRRREEGVLARHLPALRAGGLTAVFDHIGGDAPYYTVYPGNSVMAADPLRSSLEALQHVKSEVDASHETLIARDCDDIRLAHDTDRIAFVLCLEGAAPIGNDLSMLRIFYDLGVRCIGLTHNQRNLLGDGIAVGASGGLTAFGKDAVREMEALGITVDVSHLNKDGFWDTVSIAQRPVIASHSNASAIHDHPRNLDDDQIRALAGTGGMIGLHAMTTLIGSREQDYFRTLLAHAEHIGSLVGPQFVGIGPDIMPDWDEETYREMWAPARDLADLTFSYPTEFDGLDKITNLAAGLLDVGFSHGEVSDILGANWLSVFERAWQAT
jgi:membrane dipeptidase